MTIPFKVIERDGEPFKIVLYGADMLAPILAAAEAARDAVKPLYGTGAPDAGLGIDGSTYIDITDPDNPILYGPKQDPGPGWGAGRPYRGPASGPLTTGSVGAGEITDDTGEQEDIRDKLGLQTKAEIFAGDVTPEAGFFPPMPNGFSAYGDSQTAQIVGGVTGWRDLVSARLGVANTNYAVSGGSVMDWGKNALANTIVAGDYSMVLPGYNDLRANGEDAEKAESYRLALGASVAWLAIPTVYRQLGSALLAGSGTTGAWAAMPTPGYGMGIYSGDAGDTVTFKAKGSAIYIGGLSISTSGGSFTVTVDGTVYGPFTQDRTVGNGGAVSTDFFAPALFRIPNLGDGEHDVTVTVVGDGNVYFLWGAGSNSFGGQLAKVLVGNTLRLQAVAAGMYAPYDQYTEAGQRLYSKIAEQVAGELASDGLDVIYVDAAGAYDPDTETSGDDIHMNQTGQDNVAAAFLSTLDMRKSFAAASAAVQGIRRAQPFQIFRGALVKKAVNQTGADYSAGVAIGLDEEVYDTDGIHSTTTNTSRLTVPVGVSAVELSGRVSADGVLANKVAFAYIRKNGADFPGAPAMLVESNLTSAHLTMGSSPPIPVVAGDYFELFLLIQDDNAVDILAATTWFAMKVLG